MQPAADCRMRCLGGNASRLRAVQ